MLNSEHLIPQITSLNLNFGFWVLPEVWGGWCWGQAGWAGKQDWGGETGAGRELSRDRWVHRVLRAQRPPLLWRVCLYPGHKVAERGRATTSHSCPPPPICPGPSSIPTLS